MAEVLAHSPSGWLSCSISLSSTGKLILAKKPAGVGMGRGHTHTHISHIHTYWNTLAYMCKQMYVHYLVTPQINSLAQQWAEARWFWKKDTSPLTKGEGWRCGVIYNSIQCEWRGRAAQVSPGKACACMCVWCSWKRVWTDHVCDMNQGLTSFNIFLMSSLSVRMCITL